MATQEIELNEALAREGIAAWETDLAELIVQLGGDLPSHILVPAIHRNRREIREIFEREMAHAGRPAPDDLTEEPRALAEAARLHLREKFLRAKVAISGANFAVAETGTVMVVESEGNGRMCLTLPDTLITVMGIEKLVPRWQDLEVFLQLLPRSSTAERMNPYTSMWTGVTPGDGPAGVPPRAAGQRPDGHARRPGRAPGAAVHQVLGLPERVPGLRADRRPRLRVAVPGPDRGDPHAPAARDQRPPGRRPDRLAPLRVVAVRGVLRGLPGPDRDPRDPRPPAGDGGRAARLAGPRLGGGGADGGRRLDVPRSVASRRGGAGRRAGRAPARPRRAHPAGARAGAAARVAPRPGPRAAAGRVVPPLVAAGRT